MKKTVAIILIIMFLMANNPIIYAISKDAENNPNINESTIQEESNIQEQSENNEDNIDMTNNTESEKQIEKSPVKAISSEEEIMTLSTNEERIPDGIYRISIADASYCHMAIEIKNGSKQVEANAQIGQWFNINNEKNKFKITYTGDGYYSIGLINTNNMLDVQNGGTASGTNIWQHADNKTDAQRWKIVKNNDGSYSFISKKNNLYLTVANGNISEGANLEVNNKKNTIGQKFNLINLDNKPSKVLENGIYKITINSKNNLALEVQDSSVENGGNIRVGKWINNTSNIQKRFEFTYENDGYYTIKSVNSGKVLEIESGGMTIETNVWQYDGNYTDSQRWKIVKNTDKSYSIINKKSEIANENNKMYLNICNGNLAQGENVEINTKNDSNSQKFKIENITNEQPLIKDGIYRISLNSDKYSYLAMEIKDGSKAPEANVQMGEWFNKNNAKNKFKITYNRTDGYYTIQSTNSGYRLDVANAGMTSGTNIWQHIPNTTNAQKWEAIINDDGSYSFKSKNNGLYLSVAGNIGIGSNIEVTNKNNEDRQKFKLISLDEKLDRTISDGVYKIETNTNNNMVVEIDGALSENSASAKISEWNDLINSQKKFIITYNEDDGYYTIENVYSGKVLEAQGGGYKNGTNVSQYDGNYTDSQRWQIIDNGDRTFSIVNKKSNLYLSVENKDVKSGRNVELYGKSNSKEQKFKIETVDIKEGIKVNETKTYKIASKIDENFYIDVKDGSRNLEANIQLGNTYNTITNEFNFVSDGRGYYIIKSVNSGNVLDSQNGWTDPETNVWQYVENGTDAQKWIIKDNGDGTVSIISKKSGLYIDVANGYATNGNNIWLHIGNGTDAQKFKLVEQEYKTEKYIEEGLYKIESERNRNITLDVEGASKDDGAIIQIFTYVGEYQQQFHIYYESNGYYYIENLLSKKVVASDGQNIKQYTKDLNKENQKWILKKQSDGYYSLVSKESGLAITIPDRNLTNGTDLKMQALTNSDYQIFMIENAGIYIDESRYPGIKDKIDKLTMAHPNWNFELLYTGINFEDATYAEYYTKDRCLVDTRTYQGGWISSSAVWSGVWASASKMAVNYFMDSRNFLNETDVFQFLDANSYVSDSVSLDGIQNQVNGSFLQNFANDVNNACIKQNVNPYFVLARLFQEQGRKGSTIGTGMDGGDGKTYYNPYNIGAQVGNDYATALERAKKEGWDTMEKALIGGIDFLKKNWLSNHQNTLYQNKFDIDLRSGSSLYTHQYMQNLSAAYSEGHTLRSCYASNGKIDSSFTFVIPIYENMPKTPCERPSGASGTSGNTQSVERGPKDAKVVVNSTLNLRENASIDSKSLRKLNNETHLLSIKRAINGNWNQVVTDDGTIGYVSGDYLQFVSDVTNCNLNKITTSNVYARIGPSISTDELYLVQAGTSVTVINTGTYSVDGHSWDRVILPDGAQAFMANEYLKQK